MNWEKTYQEKLVSLEQAAQAIESGDRIGMTSANSAPVDLMNAITDRYEELEDVTVVSGLALYGFKHLEGKYRGHVNYHTIFVGPVERWFLDQGNIEVTPYHFSQTDELFGILDCNVVIVEVSPPDSRGYMSLGPFGTFNTHAVLEHADKVIVQVNERTPYVYGTQAHLHVNDVDLICERTHDLPEIPDMPVGDEERLIAGHIVEHINDGDTIQVGIGKITDAVAAQLDCKKDLGVHTEMLTNSMVSLAEKGVITCSRKTFHPGKMTCTFGIGNRKLYDFMDHNPFLETLPISYVNNVANVAKIDNFVSINNALTVDLSGQVCSESIGARLYSGTGGQVDFVRGARLSKGGKSFLALKSVARTDEGPVSRIAAQLPLGSVVTTLRTDVQYVVTEYGIADLYNRSISERVKALVNIAHPDFRDDLMRQAYENGLVHTHLHAVGKAAGMD